jgi:hypothetical protein
MERDNGIFYRTGSIVGDDIDLCGRSNRISRASVPVDLTITALAKALPNSWAKQQQHVGLTTSRT